MAVDLSTPASRFVRSSFRILTALSVVALPACGDDGTAPRVQDLAFSPDHAVVGVLTTLTGSIAFEDPDADLTELVLEITPPGGTVPEAQTVLIGDDGRRASGTLTLLLRFVPPLAGTYPVAVTVKDAEGNTSNRLMGELVAR